MLLNSHNIHFIGKVSSVRVSEFFSDSFSWEEDSYVGKGVMGLCFNEECDREGPLWRSSSL